MRSTYSFPNNLFETCYSLIIELMLFLMFKKQSGNSFVWEIIRTHTFLLFPQWLHVVHIYMCFRNYLQMSVYYGHLFPLHCSHYSKFSVYENVCRKVITYKSM